MNSPGAGSIVLGIRVGEHSSLESELQSLRSPPEKERAKQAGEERKKEKSGTPCIGCRVMQHSKRLCVKEQRCGVD